MLRPQIRPGLLSAVAAIGFALVRAPLAAESVDFYPLETGATLVYLEDGAVTRTETVQPGTVLVGGVPTKPILISGGVDDGVQQFGTNDSLGLRAHRAVIPGVDGGEILYTTPGILLPPSFMVGDQISQVDQPMVLLINGVGAVAAVFNNAGVFASIETVTVPAGTFAAYRIDRDSSIFVPLISQTIVEQGSTWYVRNIGSVRAEGTIDGSPVLFELLSHNQTLCGDGTGDGVIAADDTFLYRRALAGLQALSPIAQDRCSTTDMPSDCDAVDVSVLIREVDGPLLEPGIGTVCNLP